MALLPCVNNRGLHICPRATDDWKPVLQFAPLKDGGCKTIFKKGLIERDDEAAYLPPLPEETGERKLLNGGEGREEVAAILNVNHITLYRALRARTHT